MTTMMTTTMIAVCWKSLGLLSLCLLPIATFAFLQAPLVLAPGNFHGRQCSIVLSLASENEVMTKSVCMLFDEQVDQFREEVTAVAEKLRIPIVSTLESNNDDESSDAVAFTHALRIVPCEVEDHETFALGIEPIEVEDGKKKKKKKRKKLPPPFFVDLCPPVNSKAGRRASGNSGTSDLLVKAVAPAKCPGGAVVWDLTAGLGRDSLILARNGAKKVCMVERNPIVGALLEDAMRRLALNEELADSLQFCKGEALEVLQRENPTDCDVVYLDPMFPPRQKQSAVKKGMTILHGLLETHVSKSETVDLERLEEEQQLLEAALAVAKLRVVVKRPAKAPLLGDGSTKPSHALTGSVNRWDVYVTKQAVE